MGEMVHLRLDTGLRKRMKRIVKDQDFPSESEFVRTAIRKELDTYERIAILKRLKGTIPLRKNPPKSDSKDVFREFGINI